MTKKTSKPSSRVRNKRHKEHIPKALREQVWIRRMGHAFEGKCTVSWCANQITVFDFHVGHNKPESKGGSLRITNLEPICARCNLSMGDQFTITEWNKTFSQKDSDSICVPCCLPLFRS